MVSDLDEHEAPGDVSDESEENSTTAVVGVTRLILIGF